MLISTDWLADFVQLPADRTMKELAHDLTLHTVEVEGYWHASGDLTSDHIVAIVGSSDPEGAIAFDVGERTIPGTAPGPLAAGVVTIVAINGGIARACTPAELGLSGMFPGGADAPIDLSDEGQIAAGTPASRALHLEGLVLEIDNKSLTNRPDLWGHLGIAREFAAIYGRAVTEPPLVEPDPARADPTLIESVDATACRRFTIATIETPSGAHRTAPLLVRSRLHQVGQRSLGLYTDLTNYAMFAVGQPSHAYDAATLTLPMSVGRGPAGRLSTLAGSTVELNSTVCTILDAKEVVAVGGVVGGSPTQVTDATSSIVLEVANFDPTQIRRSSLELGVRTDASARFEKGQDTYGVDRGRGYLFHLVAEYDPTAVITAHASLENAATARARIRTSLRFLADRIGTPVSTDEVRSYLAPLGIEIETDGNEIVATAPTWRSTGDLSIEHDILEEVARMIGYDELPPTCPTIELRSPTVDRLLSIERYVREYFAFRVHAQEILTYPWSIDRLLVQQGFDPAAGVRFDGAPAEDRATLRPSLVPNMVGAVEVNGPHHERFRIFEVGTVYLPSSDPAPTLSNRLAAAFVGSDLSTEFRAALGAIEGLGRAARIDGISTGPATEGGWGDSVAARSILCNGEIIGRVAAMGADVLSSTHVAVVLELALDDLRLGLSRDNHFAAFSTQPNASVDLSMLLADGVAWSALIGALDAEPVPHLQGVRLVDEYRGASLGSATRSLTIRLELSDAERTLTASDKARARETVASRLGALTGVTIRE